MSLCKGFAVAQEKEEQFRSNPLEFPTGFWLDVEATFC